MKEFKRSSGVIYKVKDEVLLCKRAPNKSMPNIWSIPSGKIEENESPKEAAIREFKEETDIDLSNELDLVSFINRYKKAQENFKQDNKKFNQPGIKKKSFKDLQKQRTETMLWSGDTKRDYEYYQYVYPGDITKYL